MRRRKPCRLESDHADHASNGLMLKAHFHIGRSSVGRALQREGILLLNTLGRWFESNRPVYQVNMRMNIATCFNKILLEIERKLKGIYDQERNRQVCSSVNRQHN